MLLDTQLSLGPSFFPIFLDLGYMVTSRSKFNLDFQLSRSLFTSLGVA